MQGSSRERERERERDEGDEGKLEAFVAQLQPPRRLSLGLLPCSGQLGGRQEVAGEQVQEAGDARQTCEDPQPQR